MSGRVVVGGGTGALGRAVVARLLDDGWDVVVPARDPEHADLPAAVTVVECDLDDAAAVDRLCERVAATGPWDALVSCSGGYSGGRAHELPDSRIEEQLRINLLGPWRLCRGAARVMLDAGRGGRIITVGSLAAVDVAAGQAAYQVSKAALLRLTQVMARELAGHGVAVASVLPGTMDTAANRASMPGADPATWLRTEDVAARISELLGRDVERLNGEVVTLRPPAG